MSDNKPDTTTWIVVCVVVAAFVLLLALNANSIFAVIVVIALGVVARIIFMATSASADVAAEIKEREEKIEREKTKQQTNELKRQKQEVELAKAYASTMKSYIFTSDDFDTTAQGILTPVVRESRKRGVPVTGQGLVQSILKSIR